MKFVPDCLRLKGTVGEGGGRGSDSAFFVELVDGNQILKYELVPLAANCFPQE